MVTNQNMTERNTGGTSQCHCREFNQILSRLGVDASEQVTKLEPTCFVYERQSNEERQRLVYGKSDQSTIKPHLDRHDCGDNQCKQAAGYVGYDIAANLFFAIKNGKQQCIEYKQYQRCRKPDKHAAEAFILEKPARQGLIKSDYANSNYYRAD